MCVCVCSGAAVHNSLMIIAQPVRLGTRGVTL